MARNIDPKNLSREDVIYVHDRPWLVDEFRLQGFDLPSVEDFDNEEDAATEEDEETVDYNDWTVARLKEEINRRNEDRDEDDEIVPDGTNKPDLVAALEADDEGDEE